jgi:hypothetical protein
MSELYNRIARSICSSKGQCVLILGPELSVNKKSGKGFRSFFREIVKKEESIRYFDDKNLFYFKDEYSRDLIQEKVLNFYKEVGDPALMEMIARIPFPLIINVCPDKALNEALVTVYNKKKDIDFSEAYFTKDSKAEFNQTTPIPSKEHPVIYNIFGSIDLEQSLILTHSKLYETLEFLLPEKSLPDNIELFLKGTANSFIFLGFKFDSWHYQLVCHKLKIKTSDPKTTICTPYFGDSDDVSIIMDSTFNMKSTQDNSFQCIQNIIRICEENYPGQIRPPSPAGSYSTFISYAWNSDENKLRENIVDLIQYEFEKDTTSLFQIFRDRKDQKYGDSIDSYMTRIGMGKTVIMVISDKYLTSIYCMTEALRISRHNDPDKRIFKIAMEDVDFNNPKKYKDFWLAECQRLLDDPTALEKGFYDNYVEVYRFIDDFMVDVKDKLNLKLKYSEVSKDEQSQLVNVANDRQDDFNNFLSVVTERMKQN